MSAGLSVATGFTSTQAIPSPEVSTSSTSRGRYFRLIGQLVLVIAKTVVLPGAISASVCDLPARSVHVRSPIRRPIP